MRRRERELEAEVQYLRGLVSSLLERLEAHPNLALASAPRAPEPSDERPYISDLPYDDERWAAHVAPEAAFAAANESLTDEDDE